MQFLACGIGSATSFWLLDSLKARVCVCLSVGIYLLTCHRQIVCLCDDPQMCPIASGTH